MGVLRINRSIDGGADNKRRQRPAVLPEKQRRALD